MTSLSPKKRTEILDAVRRGTVPKDGLDVLAVGLDKFLDPMDQDLAKLAGGGSAFKAVRGDYGCGKTFFSRWLQERARSQNLATAEVQISETETPLHRLETVYRRMIERLATQSSRSAAFRGVLDSWFYVLEEDVLSNGKVDANDADTLLAATNELMEQRLNAISRQSPSFSAALRGYRAALAEGDAGVAEGLVAWLSGQPNVAAAVKRTANIKGEVDHFAALSFLQGLLVVLKDSGHPGMVLVLDEVETLQRVRGDVREKALNALRQLIDEIDAGRFPGLMLIITGTPAFFEGPQGIKKLPPLAQRLHTDFDTEMRFDNPRAPQIRLRAFDFDMLLEVGRKFRDIFADGSKVRDRILATVDDALIESLAKGVSGTLGGKTGIAPRIFLKKLVVDILDRVELHPGFDPRKDYRLTIKQDELNLEERNQMPASSVEDIKLEL
ncbi:BREX system ATP-binding protein BrxD [Synoicihabitans lomoniglobus]|uniref:BREX system ATP-binding protein BrxD n=1 Tax=Synoicihabitans lomoniglobus TaxID=2909285 RepID=A0AAF0CMH3_9BACT|nr:BREX system ATP-binding protein BrxD [Opitutaceae bacterium LMO-M01]WED64128.1 BREX system ATP-binding protein BrxD [Opitutaceae bacterium LMO-M01]